MSDRLRTGLYFGSFNPIHIGHLIIAQAMLDAAKLMEVWFVVSPLNPFKQKENLLHHFDRLEMVERAIADHFKFKASDVEFHLPQPSFTADTLLQLRNSYPDRDFQLIIGGDNLSHFHKWKNYEDILKNHTLLVYPRPNEKIGPLNEHPSVKHLDAPLLDISATFIRQTLQNGGSIQYLVPDAVRLLIESKGYYLR